MHQGLPDIFRTPRYEAAGRREQRPEEQLIAPDGLRSQPARAHAWASAACSARGRFSANRRMSSTSSGNGRRAALGRATTTSSTSAAISARTCRYASRTRRRARLRFAAPRSCRLTAKPARRVSARRHNATKFGRSSRLPYWKTAWNSADRRRRSPRGSVSTAGDVGTALGYTVRRLRPFARRRLSTFRPPCVFIRERNPCVFFRRRTFGWNVLFMDKLSCGWKNQRSLRTALDQVKARKPLATVCTAMVRSPPASSTAPSGHPGARGFRAVQKVKRPFVADRSHDDVATWPAVWQPGESSRSERSPLSTPVDKSVCNFLRRHRPRD